MCLRLIQGGVGEAISIAIRGNIAVVTASNGVADVALLGFVVATGLFTDRHLDVARQGTRQDDCRLLIQDTDVVRVEGSVRCDRDVLLRVDVSTHHFCGVALPRLGASLSVPVVRQ